MHELLRYLKSLVLKNWYVAGWRYGGMGNRNVWYVCSVEGEVTHKPPQPVIATEVKNRFDCLTEEDEDGECKGQGIRREKGKHQGGRSLT